MRRLFMSVLVTAAASVPLCAMAGNQEIAERIAASLQDSGQLHHYRIGVKYQEGTVWLRGHVGSQEQMNSALKLVFQAANVVRVVNNLEVRPGEQVAATAVSRPQTDPESSPAERQVKQPLQLASGAFAPEATWRAPAAVTPQAIELDSRSAATLQGVGATRVPPQSNAASKETPETQDKLNAKLRASRAAELEEVATIGRKKRTRGVPAESQLEQGSGSQEERLETELASWVPEQTRAQPAAVPAEQPAERTLAETAQPQMAAQLVSGVPVGVPAMVAPLSLLQNAGGAVGPQTNGAPLPIGSAGAEPLAQYVAPVLGGMTPVRYDQPQVPNYAWPSYAAHPNYAGLTYPKQYSPTAWPYIGPFYPYPQVPLGWRKVTLEWHDGWWQLDFSDHPRSQWFSALFRPPR